MKKRMVALVAAVLVAVAGAVPAPARAAAPRAVGPTAASLDAARAELPPEATFTEVMHLPVGGGEGEVGYLLDDAAAGPRGPMAIFAGDEDSLYILDSVNRRVLHVVGGRLAGTVNLPYANEPDDLVVTPTGKLIIKDETRFYVARADGALADQTHWEVPGHYPTGLALDASGRPLVTATGGGEYPLSPGPAPAPRITLSRPDPHTVRASAPGRPAVDVGFAEAGGILEFIGSDRRGHLYFHALDLADTSLTAGEGSLRVFDSRGRPTGVARIPRERHVATPLREFAITPAGTVYYLQAAADGVHVYRITPGAGYRSVLPAIRTAALSRTRAASRPAPQPYLPAGEPVTRSIASLRAWQMVHYRWFLAIKNYQWEPGVSEKPDWLDGSLIEDTLEGIPYAWGGMDSHRTSSAPATWGGFGAAMAAGASAGNVLHQGNYKAGTAGLDCSGFVQVAWGVGPEKVNSEMLRHMSDAIPRSAVRAMDAAHRPGHIMLLRHGAGENLDHVVTTMESTTAGDDKAKQWTYRSWRYLMDQGYEFIRYRQMQD